MRPPFHGEAVNLFEYINCPLVHPLTRTEIFDSFGYNGNIK
jgi:hypothetical protein